MAGRPRGRQPRKFTVPVRFTADGVDHLDRLRGKADRSTYLRSLVDEDARRKGLA
jgi:hypothetical protein